jgi:hypothetical protein
MNLLCIQVIFPVGEMAIPKFGFEVVSIFPIGGVHKMSTKCCQW